MTITALAFFALMPTLYSALDSPLLEIDETAQPIRVTVRGGASSLQSPEEGLWSIAADWEEGWPGHWHHAHPERCERVGEWWVLYGKIEMDGGGAWHLRDVYRPEGALIRCTRRFEWHGEKPLDRCTLSVRFLASGVGAGAVLPGILYHGNPSGAKSGRTPVYTGTAGEEALFEEHRFPMPFVSFEYAGDSGVHGTALHSLPCPVPYGNKKEQWWSMGLAAGDEATDLLLLSGPCASNGQRNVIKAVQPGFSPYPDAWLSVPPGTIIEKTFYLDAWTAPREGSAFQRAVNQSLQLYPPYLTPDLPSFSEIIEKKLYYADSRWLDRGAVAGYCKYPNKDTLVMGWCGQAETPGYALPVLAQHFTVTEAQERAQRSLDFLSGAAFFEKGFHTWYLPETDSWERDETLSQGQAMLSFARAIRNGRGSSMNTSRWEDFLKKACDFHANRILKDDWSPLSTDEAFFVAPLCMAADLFEEPLWLQAAQKAGALYAKRSLTMTEPYWGGTLDASCEDKEGAFAALQAFLALYDGTGKAQYLEWAEHALDLALTYTVVWDIDLPAGRLRNHGFKTRGWTAVSVQNQHIDVYGVLIAPLVYRMGVLKEDQRLQDLALLMYRSCGQLLDVWGSQGEQPQQTNYAQRGDTSDVEVLRGGYVEDWTVFWITAHFLNGAAQFIEMGAPILE
ncbi:MAG: hypothetical protein GX117_11325 [Candidatus Hydrogenedentes bacterium]|nr:hypothetical protein [Candidatus Hydrogenedentota bacterium]